MQTYHTIALIVAGGKGDRFGEPIPKQYQLLNGQPILRHTVQAFVAHPLIDEVRVVINPDHQDAYNQAVEGLSLLDAVYGGEERQDSVRHGLESLEGYAPKQVLIHDAARPFINASLISRVLDALEETAAVVPALPIADTLKRASNGDITETVDRSDLFRIQTPQGFDYQEILEAHRQCKGEILTDDSLLLEQAGKKVKTVYGDKHNIKITTKEDLEMSENQQATQKETRVAMGYDVHRFFEEEVTDHNIMICGVEVPHNRKIEAHSDGDVGIHSLVDALLGTIAKEDIGFHFSPHDDRWKDQASYLFLEKAHHWVKEEGGEIINVDVTIICQAPKIATHRENMRKRLAEILGISIKRVSVKATTTEKLGYLGNKEGIAAQAVASVSLPAI